MTTRPELHSGERQPDRNFDDIAGRFRRTIYDTPKGQLRLAALQQDFQDLKIPLEGKRVLDLGGGQGQFSLQLAKQGADIQLCDLSEEMIRHARSAFNDAQQPLHAVCCPLQDAGQQLQGPFDLVMNHAVLEWLEAPLQELPTITRHVRDGGWLSLMFYNLHGHEWRQLMNGRTHAPQGATDRLRKEGNAPQHPLDPQAVMQALEQQGFEIVRWRGIRCIHDHMHQKIRERIGQQSVQDADLEFGLKDPYRLLGRYIHVMACKPSSADSSDTHRSQP